MQNGLTPGAGPFCFSGKLRKPYPGFARSYRKRRSAPFDQEIHDGRLQSRPARHRLTARRTAAASTYAKNSQKQVYPRRRVRPQGSSLEQWRRRSDGALGRASSVEDTKKFRIFLLSDRLERPWLCPFEVGDRIRSAQFHWVADRPDSVCSITCWRCRAYPLCRTRT